MYVEPRKMVQMSWFAGQKLRHICREQTYGHQGGKAAGGGGVVNIRKKKNMDIHMQKNETGLLSYTAHKN